MDIESNTLSIITINYNNVEGLVKTIQSVTNQTYKNIQYIIIDGGSTDGSVEVIKSNYDGISYWISEKDRGIYHAQNKGIEQSTCEYVLFLNSGDTLSKETIISDAFQYSFKQDIVYGDLYIDYGKGDIQLADYPDVLTFDYFYNNGYLPHPSSFIRRTLFFKTGLYNESFKISSDWEFWLKTIFLYQASYKRIPLPISIFDTNGISPNKKSAEVIKLEKEEVYKKYFPSFIPDYEKFNNSKQIIKTNAYIRILRKLGMIKVDL